MLKPGQKTRLFGDTLHGVLRGAWPRPGCIRVEVVGNDLFASFVEDIGGTFQEQDTENVFLKLGGVHLAAQNIGGSVEMAFQLGKGQFGHINRPRR
ncbi:MAG TPA: hypothetical protein VHP83_20520 [Aggregatilineaceae bacterium]|nr:hypothetical protein [Aggregatilineaceae bacterium]